MVDIVANDDVVAVVIVDVGIGADIGGEKEKHQVRRIPRLTTQFPNTGPKYLYIY